MQSDLNNIQLPSESQIESLKAIIETLRDNIEELNRRHAEAEAESKRTVELLPDFSTSLYEKPSKRTVRQFQARQVNKQAAIYAQLQQAQALLNTVYQVVDDLLLVTGAKMMNHAQAVHEALREASKEDPSLLPAVQELDEAYKQALAEEEQNE